MKLLNLKTDLPYLARKSKDVNEFLDEGLSTGIFETTPIPNQTI